MRVFPFDKKLMRRWRDGIRLWPSKDVIRSFPKRADPQLHEDIVALLLKRKIIEPMAKPRYVANMFVIRKGEDSFRPIFNYAAMTPHLKSPSFVLPSVYQVVRRKRWPTNLWFAKIDFAQAFFNINLHPKSRMVTGFQVNGTRYQFRYMPFGISIAPFVCQTLLNAIMETIKKDFVVEKLIKCQIDNATLKKEFYVIVFFLDDILNYLENKIDDNLKVGLVCFINKLKVIDSRDKILEKLIQNISNH